MAISQAVCTSFKQELLQGIHNFTNGSGGGTTTSTGSGNTFKLALYTSSASLGAATTAFTTSNEVSGTGYSSGGSALTNVTPTTSSTTALTDFADLTFSSSTITARGAMIYNSSTTAGSANRAVLILDFGADKSSSFFSKLGTPKMRELQNHMMKAGAVTQSVAEGVQAGSEIKQALQQMKIATLNSLMVFVHLVNTNNANDTKFDSQEQKSQLESIQNQLLSLLLLVLAQA